MEEIGDRGRVALVVGDLEREVFVGDTVVERFRAVDGSVDLEKGFRHGRFIDLS